LGIGLLVGLLALLLTPLWLFSVGGHPLANAPAPRLCAYLETGPLRRVDRLALSLNDGFERGQGDAGWPKCTVQLESWGSEPPGTGPTLDATLISERALRATDPRSSTEKYIEVWVDEARASGARVEKLAVPWLEGALLEYSAESPKVQVVGEDDGIVLLIRGGGISSDQVLLFAGDLAERLRQPL